MLFKIFKMQIYGFKEIMKVAADLPNPRYYQYFNKLWKKDTNSSDAISTLYIHDSVEILQL